MVKEPTDLEDRLETAAPADADDAASLETLLSEEQDDANEERDANADCY